MKKIEKPEKPSVRNRVHSLIEFKKRYFPATANATNEQESKTPEEVGTKIGKRAAGLAQLFSTSK